MQCGRDVDDASAPAGCEGREGGTAGSEGAQGVDLQDGAECIAAHLVRRSLLQHRLSFEFYIHMAIAMKMNIGMEQGRMAIHSAPGGWGPGISRGLEA